MRPSSLVSGLPILGALAALLAYTGGAAWAAGLPLLVVHRTDDARDCPSAQALAALVATQMKRPALEPAGAVAPDRGLDVQIYRSEKGFTAVIRAGGKTHQLSDKGAACTSLAVALSISIAVLLDTEPLPPEPEPEPTLPVSAPPPPVAPQPLPESTIAPFEAPRVEVGAEDQVPEPARRTRVTLSAAPVLTVGLLQAWAGGVTSEVEVRLGRFSASAGILALPGESYATLMGQVSLNLTAGVVRGCGSLTSVENPIRLAACVETYAGTMRGSGQYFPANFTSSLPWAAVGTSALFEQPIWGPLSWGARAGLVIPLLRASFMVDHAGEPAFAAAPVGGAWDAQLRVSIW